MISERSIKLLTQKLAGELSTEELAEFNELIANDEDFKRQYNVFKHYWGRDDKQYSNSDAMFKKIKGSIIIPEQEIQKEGNEVGYRRFPLNFKNIAAAVLILLSSVAAFFYTNHNSETEKKNNFYLAKTPSRVKSKITLSDGSVITLNSLTTLRYPAAFKGKTREVYLDGEAFFDVKKDHEHPFIVHTDKMNIKVLGTAFNIKSYFNDAKIETTLIRGSIEVTLTDRPSDRIILKPNVKLTLKSTLAKKQAPHSKLLENVKYDSTGTSYTLTNLTHFKSNDTTIVETSWVNNKLIFKDETFTDLATVMERWYGVKVAFKNDIAKNYRFTGIFEKESVLQAFEALQMIEPFSYKLKDETIYIY